MTLEPRPYVPDDEIDLRELVRTLWGMRWVILGVTAVATLAAAVVSLYVLPPVYESRTYIQLSEHSAPAYATPQAASRVLTNVPFLRPIAARHGITDDRELEGMVRADPVRDTRMVYLRIRDRNPDRLQAFTRDVVQAFLQVASEKVLERRRLAQERYEVITAQIRALGQVAAAYRHPSAGRSAVAAASVVDPSVVWLRQVYGELFKAQREIATELAEIEPPTLVQAPFFPPSCLPPPRPQRRRGRGSGVHGEHYGGAAVERTPGAGSVHCRRGASGSAPRSPRPP